MITAVDTNIILDVLIPEEPFGESSKKLLDHLTPTSLHICNEMDINDYGKKG